MTEQTLILEIGLGLAVLALAPFFIHAWRRERRTVRARQEAERHGLHEPLSLHPVVDPGLCIGTGNCASVCPEEVIGFRDGQAVAVRPALCIGHGLCERACPMEAITLVFGTEERGVELPRVQGNFETNVRGIYVVGELGGMGLVANAFEQGRQCVEGIAAEKVGPAPDGIDDLLIVGCGPAGLSAALTARARGLSYTVLEKEDLGGTVRHYPRKKLVMTRPVAVPGWGKLPVREIHKEELIGLWEEIVGDTGVKLRTGVTVESVERVADLRFRIPATGGVVHEARRVVLAIGRRGIPRKLGIPGEDRPNVQYSLLEPEAFAGDRALVVGGGDSAVEAALALAEQPGTEVRVSYRRNGFRRIKPRNRERVDAALERGALDVLWESEPVEIGPDRVVLSVNGETRPVPADQVFVLIGGDLPTRFLRECGIQIDTKFGEP
jgi:thioredoxin reductase/NAD-dependent dihydropyrimidine dehydrogenase PreA subunit